MPQQQCPHCGASAKQLFYGAERKLKCPNCKVIDLCSTSASENTAGAILSIPPNRTAEYPSTSSNGATARGPSLSRLGANGANGGTSSANGYTNGHAIDSEPRAPSSLEAWRGTLLTVGLRALREQDAYKNRACPAEELLEPLTADIRLGVDVIAAYGIVAPRELGPQDILDECERCARLCIEEWCNYPIVKEHPTQLPAVKEPDNTALVDFEERAPVDAYDAFEAMKGDAREYSLEGLIREGCTAVLSGLMSSGKTTLAMNISRAWALGEPVLGRQCKPNRTLVVVSPKEFEAWADTIGFWGLKGAIYLVESTKAHFSDAAMTVAWFAHWMRKLDCRTFVLDTLFDFFGMPPNRAGDSNRIAMNEQTPLLQCVREHSYSGLILGHAPKSEAKAIDPRDPEEAFGGHSAWTAQHRMRMTVRRKSQGCNAIITGKGGHGDRGILKEEMVLFDESTRLVTLGGLFSEHMGRAAMPEVLDVLSQLGGVASISKMVTTTGKAEKWIRAGLKQACKQQLATRLGKNRATRYALAGESDQGEIFDVGVH